MTDDDTLDLDDPDVEAELERRVNIYYRLLEAEDVDFTAEDFFLLNGAFDYLTEDENKELGYHSMMIEREGREGLGFGQVTDHEREFAKVLKKGIDRYRESGEVSSDDFPDDFLWRGHKPERDGLDS